MSEKEISEVPQKMVGGNDPMVQNHGHNRVYKSRTQQRKAWGAIHLPMRNVFINEEPELLRSSLVAVLCKIGQVMGNSIPDRDFWKKKHR